MLSRVADSLYWMARYLERAEHSSRLIRMHLNMMLDQTDISAEERWQRVLTCLGSPLPGGHAKDPQSLMDALVFDPGMAASITSCIMRSRENARQVREQISSEMWEELNRLFHEVRRQTVEDVREGDQLAFLGSVLSGAHLFQGVTDSTMRHGEGWQFIRLGRYLERARSTATLIDVHFREFVDRSERHAESTDHLEWVGLLRSCTAFEAFLKINPADFSPERIAEFLLLDSDFPHSVRFAAGQLHEALQALPVRMRGADHEPIRLSGKLEAVLSYNRITEILAEGVHPFLESVTRLTARIHAAIHENYIDYPIAPALIL
jgi:uncharacterized alpha-E superfamily protein